MENKLTNEEYKDALQLAADLRNLARRMRSRYGAWVDACTIMRAADTIFQAAELMHDDEECEENLHDDEEDVQFIEKRAPKYAVGDLVHVIDGVNGATGKTVRIKEVCSIFGVPKYILENCGNIKYDEKSIIPVDISEPVPVSKENRMRLGDFAELLDGREYGYPQFSKEEIRTAKENGIVIAYGCSDDLFELDGAIREEAGCFDGGDLYFSKTGDFWEDEDDPDGIAKYPNHVLARWCEETDDDGETIPWTYETGIPHVTFNIMEEGRVYCRAMLFYADDLK